MSITIKSQVFLLYIQSFAIHLKQLTAHPLKYVIKQIWIICIYTLSTEKSQSLNQYHFIKHLLIIKKKLTFHSIPVTFLSLSKDYLTLDNLFVNYQMLTFNRTVNRTLGSPQHGDRQK